MMAILTLQQRQRELGRIRIGQKVGAKGRPEKLDRFRFTSPARTLIESVAARYGGTVQPWNGAGTDQWEVITDARRVPILVPPQPVSQYFELWSGGGCLRRCDGNTEMLTDSPCLCDPDPEQRECKPTTRLNVVLRDVHGVGVWRLESHGWSSATELPQTAAFLAAATQQGTYLPAHLALEERVSKRAGQTRRFIVPTLEVDVTPGELMAGGGGALAIGENGPGVVESPERAALPAGDRDWFALIDGATTAEELRVLWEDAKAANAPDEVAAAITVKVRAVRTVDVPPVDPDAVWQQIVAKCPAGWTLDDLELRFIDSLQVKPEQATGEQMLRFLDEISGVPA